MNSLLRLPVVGLVLLILVAVSYRSTLNNGFLEWDDDVCVTENPAVLGGLSWPGVKYAFTTFDSGNYIPLTWLSLELDSSLAGVNPRWFHGVNAALHWANSLLVFIAACRLTGARERSFLVAALFAVHPLHVESVAWVTERKDLLSTLFLFLAVLAWIRYVRRPAVSSYILVAVLMTLGLLAKSMLVTLPFLLLLVDLFLLDRAKRPEDVPEPSTPDARAAAAKASARQFRLICLDKLPLLGLSLLCGLITLVAQQSAGAFHFGEPLLPSARVMNAVDSTACYVVQTVWPTGLSPFYPHPVGSLPATQVAGDVALLLAITWLAFRSGPERRVTAFGWLWFLIALAPVIGIIQVGVQARADRYTYVPHFGLMILVVWLAAELFARIRLPILVRRGLSIVAVAVGVVLTSQQVLAWRDTESVWRQALRVDPHNELALYNLGITIARTRGPDPESYKHLQAVVDIGRHSDMALYAMGTESENAGNLAEAAEYYRRALVANPKHQQALHHLADALVKIGNQPMALAAFEEITKREPESSEAWKRRGLLEAKQGMADKAIASFLRALQLTPQDWGIETNLGLALWQANRLPEAVIHLQSAVRLSPENPNAHVNLADAAMAMGDRSKAVEHYQAALKLNPKDDDAQAKLKKALEQKP